MTASTGQLKPGAGGEKKGDDYFVQTLGVVQLDSEEDIRLQVGKSPIAVHAEDGVIKGRRLRREGGAGRGSIRERERRATRGRSETGLIAIGCGRCDWGAGWAADIPHTRPCYGAMLTATTTPCSAQIKLLCEAMENVKRRVNQIAGSNHLNPIDFPTRNELNEVKKVIMADISDIDAKYVK